MEQEFVKTVEDKAQQHVNFIRFAMPLGMKVGTIFMTMCAVVCVCVVPIVYAQICHDTTAALSMWRNMVCVALLLQSLAASLPLWTILRHQKQGYDIVTEGGLQLRKHYYVYRIGWSNCTLARSEEVLTSYHRFIKLVPNILWLVPAMFTSLLISKLFTA